MNELRGQRTLVTLEELRVAAGLIEARFTDPKVEDQRIVQVRRYLGSAFQLDRAVRAQTQCALVNHCGTRGSHEIAEPTEQLFAALVEYAAQVSELAAYSRGLELEVSGGARMEAMAAAQTR